MNKIISTLVFFSFLSGQIFPGVVLAQTPSYGRPVGNVIVVNNKTQHDIDADFNFDGIGQIHFTLKPGKNNIYRLKNSDNFMGDYSVSYIDPVTGTRKSFNAKVNAQLGSADDAANFIINYPESRLKAQDIASDFESEFGKKIDTINFSFIAPGEKKQFSSPGLYVVAYPTGSKVSLRGGGNLYNSSGHVDLADGATVSSLGSRIDISTVRKNANDIEVLLKRGTEDPALLLQALIISNARGRTRSLSKPSAFRATLGSLISALLVNKALADDIDTPQSGQEVLNRLHDFDSFSDKYGQEKQQLYGDAKRFKKTAGSLEEESRELFYKAQEAEKRGDAASAVDLRKRAVALGDEAVLAENRYIAKKQALFALEDKAKAEVDQLKKALTGLDREVAKDADHLLALEARQGAGRLRGILKGTGLLGLAFGIFIVLNSDNPVDAAVELVVDQPGFGANTAGGPGDTIEGGANTAPDCSANPNWRGSSEDLEKLFVEKISTPGSAGATFSPFGKVENFISQPTPAPTPTYQYTPAPAPAPTIFDTINNGFKSLFRLEKSNPQSALALTISAGKSWSGLGAAPCKHTNQCSGVCVVQKVTRRRIQGKLGYEPLDRSIDNRRVIFSGIPERDSQGKRDPETAPAVDDYICTCSGVH